VKSDIPLVTVAVPSFNHGRYLNDALESIFTQRLAVEVFVMDGGSTDNSIAIIKKWERHLAGWRSERDGGQAAAINAAIALGHAPYVCWLNSDDWWLDDAMLALTHALQAEPEAAFAYGRAWNVADPGGKVSPVWVRPFTRSKMAVRCLVSQPATLIRRSAWEQVGGLDATLQMAMDYDLWWRLFNKFGTPHFVDAYVAVNRDHNQTKTNASRRLHYQEAMAIVRRHYGRIPLKWWLAQPYAVWYRSWKNHYDWRASSDAATPPVERLSVRYPNLL
jgi:glycosyltransferase involved in cell wall biosynthesis